MNQTIIKPKSKFYLKLLAALLVGILVIFVVTKEVVAQRLAEFELQTRVLISEQETLLAAIAITTARDGGDVITERIIKDCPFTERVRFDSLLGRLNSGLNRAELVELDRLFGRCGNFFAERKAVMVARLQREIEIYKTFVQQLNSITNTSHESEYQVPQWNTLAELELKQSELFSELVVIQDQIITSLLAGNTRTSEELSTILQTASEIQETLIVTNQQASDIRSRLVAL